MKRLQIRVLENAHLVWAFLVLFIILISIGHMHGNTALGKWGILGIIVFYTLFSNGNSFNSYRNIFAIFAILFFYSILVSVFKARSALLALQIFSVFYFFCTLCDIKDKKKVTTITLPIKAISTSFKFSDLITIIVIIAALIQATSLCSAYIQSPIRVTGLFLDYSHASFFIVLCFGIAYPSLKTNATTALITFILFLGVFTTFSRTSNFLVFIFLGFMFVAEYKLNNLKRFWLVIASISTALAVVYLYPGFIDAEVVNRHGLKHLATMNSRIHYWQFAIDAITLNPIWGYGPGNYEFLGPKDKSPFELITFAHNDYLQIWVALGIFWLLAFIYAVSSLVLKYLPIYVFRKEVFDMSHFCAWVLVLCCALYMLINFIVFAMPFQLLFAVILVNLVHYEQNKNI